MELIKPTLEILREFYKAPEKNLKLILSRYLDNKQVSESQGVTRAVYGVIRKDRILIEIIKKYSRLKLEKIELDTLILMKIGIYLLIFSWSYPDHAAVNELVTAARKSSKSFLNANLRTIGRQREDIFAMVKGFKAPALRFSISDLLIDNLEPLSADLEKDLEYLNQEPNFHLRVNTHSYGYGEMKELLEKHHIELKELPAFQSFEVKTFGGKIKGFLNKRFFYLQNTASQMVAIITSRYATGRILDCCAAPGTKAVTLSMIRPGMKIFANDISTQRVEIMREFIAGFDLPVIHLLNSDIRSPAVKGTYDFIVADAPCTSSATLRKNPDLKLKITQERVDFNAERQREIMKMLIPRAKPGGYLLYAVCSFLKAETKDVIEEITERENLEVVDLSGLMEEFGFNFRHERHGCYLMPTPEINNDLFYISLLKKNTGYSRS